jgi:monofunctional biosynthetic peptidoglycan transglycosylase
LRLSFIALAGLLLLSIVLTASLRWLNPPTTAFMLEARVAALLSADASLVIEQRWLDLARQSPWAGVAVIAAEDQKFRRHRGFDFNAMQSAIDAHQRGASLRGASTLSQQLAKNLYLWSGRSWLRKGLEAWLTVLLESLLDKRRILELYLNVVEFGPGVYGVEAASQRYFGHGAEALTAQEAAALAAVLPSPSNYSVTALSDYVRARQRWILAQMRQLGGVAVVQGLLP